MTEGIDLRQYQRNPILLWMHRRSFNGDSMPIGRIENLRIDGDRLIGTPVFDQKDEFAKKIESKWEDGFLRMASAGIEVVEVSNAPEYVQPGQTRATIIRCKLEEVSIVDIGANDEALQLSHGGKVLQLAAGEQSDIIPLLDTEEEEELKQIGPNEWIAAGTLPVEDLEEALDMDLPNEELEFDTVGGMVLSCLNEIPPDGTELDVEIFGLKIHVNKIEDKRIVQCRISKIESEKGEDKKDEEEKA